MTSTYLDRDCPECRAKRGEECWVSTSSMGDPIGKIVTVGGVWTHAARLDLNVKPVIDLACSIKSSYSELCDDLVQLAVKYELARRAHERAVDECARARRGANTSLAFKGATPGLGAELELAIALERRTRGELAEAESAYRAAATTITAELEARSGAAIRGVDGR